MSEFTGEPGEAPADFAIQVIFTPALYGALKEWLDSHGLHLYPIPVGEDLPTFGIAATRKSAGYTLATALGDAGTRVTVHETTTLPDGRQSDRLTATLPDGTQVGMDVRFEEDA